VSAESIPGPGDDPIESFLSWHAAARESEALDAAACCLATASIDGRPSARMVLYRGMHHGRLTFYTNLESRKAAELRDNPLAAMVFHWQSVGRQVRVEGEVELLSPDLSDRYFATRPRGSQLGAWASPQSRTLSGRGELEQRLAEIERRFAGAEVPRPAFWGGFGILPLRIEFWEQGEHRLHRRSRFTREAAGWRVESLAP